jgi:RNA polymerase sigma-70 factor (ECF subfamily)
MDASLSQTFARWRTSGDPRGLAEVFDRAAPELLRVAIHLVGEVGAAEDLVQATFLTAIERAAQFDASRRLEPWLAGILENHARDLARSAARTPDPQRLEQRLEKTPLEEALARELSAEVAAAVDRLPEPYRRTLLLRVRHGLAPADIAHVLAESPGTVRVRLHRALELLRKQLPIGIALGALFALEPARGMSSVKAAVLAASAGGVLVMKKVMVAAAVLALLLLGWWTWPAVTPEVVANKPESAPARLALEESGGQKPEELSNATAASEARKEAQPAGAQPVFHFRGRVVDGESGAPLEGASIELHPARSLTIPEIKRQYADVLYRDWNVSWGSSLGWPYVADPPSTAQRAGQEPLRVCVPPDAGAKPLASARSSADGGFDLVEFDPQGFFVCTREGYGPRLLPMRRAARTFVIRDGQGAFDSVPLDSLLVRMYPVRSVHGSVIDEQGERVRERIRLSFEGMKASETQPPPVGDPQTVGSWAVETDSQGAFVFEFAAQQIQVNELEPRWSICRTAIHPDDHQSHVYPDSWAAGELDRPIQVVVRRTPVLRVRDHATHEPIEDLFVVARSKVDGEPRLSGRFFAPKGVLRLVHEKALFRDPRPEERELCLLHVWSAGYAFSTVEAQLGRSGTDVEIELTRGELPITEGSLVRAGRGLPGVPISITADSRGGWSQEDDLLIESSTTDEQGRFHFHQPPGFYALHFTLDGVPRGSGIELPLARPLVIDLSKGASVRVHVRDSNGVPCVDHLVSLDSKISGQRSLRTDANGDALFDGVAAGSCQVWLSYSKDQLRGFIDYDQQFELADGQLQRVEVTIPPDEPRFAHLVVAGEINLSNWRAHDSRGDSRDWRRVEADGRIPIDIQRGLLGLEFDHGGETRWQFSLPKDPPADLVLRIDLGGPAYEVELVDAATRAPIRALVVGAPKGAAAGPGPVVFTATDERGIAHLVGLASASTEIYLYPRGVAPLAGDPLYWDHGWGTCGFEPTHQASAPAAHVTIEVPKIEEQRFSSFTEMKLSGVVRSGGQPLGDYRVNGIALVAQADGQLLLHPPGPSIPVEDVSGRFELRMPLTARARLSVWDSAAGKRLAPIEWEPTPGLLEQLRDFDFP